MKIYTHEELPQGSDEWHAVRLGKIGGTDAYTVSVNGKGAETLALKKAAEIITGRSQNTFQGNADTERGNELEQTARLAYEMASGNLVKQVGYVEKSKYIGVSPDGFAGEGLVEIKCPADHIFLEFIMTKKIKSNYLWQMQHQMWITDKPWDDFVVYNDSLDRVEITRVERDEKAIEKLRIGSEAVVKKIEEIILKYERKL